MRPTLNTTVMPLRALLRAPGFALTACFTLALGIGLSTAVFTVADATLLRRLPVRDQDRLVSLSGAKRDGSVTDWPVDLPQAREIAASTRALAAVGWVAYEGASPTVIRDGNDLTRLNRALVSGNYFGVLGARAILGRTLLPSDDVVGAQPVVVISHRTWQSRYGASPDALDQRITLEESGITARVVGVMPEGLEYPAGTDFWGAYVPARLRSETDTTAYTAVTIVARLAPGATAAAAEAELTSFYSRQPSPYARVLQGFARPLPLVILGDVRPAVIAFIVAAALLLLITCINVVNLLLVRGIARAREMAVRAALGASRGQVVAQLLAENAMLALAGGALGMAVAVAGVQGFLAFAPDGVPLLDRVRLDGSAFVGAVGITAAAMLLFGVAPALAGARGDLRGALGSVRQTAGRGMGVAREMLVAAQVALAVLTLSAAALVGRSLMKLQGAELGFDASSVLVAELSIRNDRYDSVEKQLRLLRELVDQLRASPGVQGASPVVAMPFSGTGGWTGRAGLPGQSPEQVAKNTLFNMDLVTPEYFATLGLRIQAGRALAAEDVKGTQPVAVVSETMASRYWPGESPIGKQFWIGRGPESAVTVVGLVPDIRYRDLREARASVYYPLSQSIFPFAPTTLVIRTAGPPASQVPAIRRAIENAAPGVTLASGIPFETLMRRPLAAPRLNAFLLGVFAFAAAALAGIGLLGVMATTVRQRTRELGLRMALGATASRILGMVVGRGLAIAGAGVVVGVVGALLANRLLASLLYNVDPTDAATLAAVALSLLVIAAVATYVPARAGSRIAPAIALRSDD